MTPSLTTEPHPVGGLAEPPAPAGRHPPAAEPRAASRAGWGGAHPVNLRLTLPTPWGRAFVVLLAGHERRSPTRRRLERARHRLATAGNALVMLAFGGLVGLAGLAALQLAAALLLADPAFPPR
jgi:hypothetical protein